MEQELVNALQSLRQAFETNVRDCAEWVQYRNAVAALRHAAQQGVRPIASPIVNGTYSFRCDPHRVGKSGMQTTGES